MKTFPIQNKRYKLRRFFYAESARQANEIAAAKRAERQARKLAANA